MRLDKSFLKKTLAYALTLAVTITSAGFGGAALPWNTHAVSAEEKPGYHLESSEQDYTYTIVRNENESAYGAWGCCGAQAGASWYGAYGAAYGYYDYKDEWHTTGGEVTTLDNSRTCPFCGAHASIGDKWKQTSGTKTVHETVSSWVPNNYTITFNPNNGQGSFTRQVTYDSGNGNTGAGATWTGYKLQGWYTGTNGTGEMVFDASGNAVNGTYWSGSGGSAVWKGLSGVSLAAFWKVDTFTQTLYFYKDGVPDSGRTKTYDVTYGSTFCASNHISDSTFEHCHYTGISSAQWTVTKAASANVYYESDVQIIDYNGNGSTGGQTASASAAYGTAVTVAANGFTRPGYTFAGWNTASNGTGTSYAPGSSLTVYPPSHNDRLTLYAIWKDVTAPTVTVTPGSGTSWALNNGIVISAADNGSLKTDNSYQYCVCTGADAPDGTWQTYTNNQRLTIGTGLSGTYYVWVKAVYDTAGNCSGTSAYHRFGPYYFDNAAPDISRVADTYGWYENRAVLNFDIPDTESGIKNISLYDVNGILLSDITGTKSFSFDTVGVNVYNLVASDNLDNTVSKAFVVKIGKNTAEPPASNAVWVWVNNLSVHAVWLPVSYTVRFDSNDSDGVSPAYGRMDNMTLTFGREYTLPSNAFSRKGYTFTGWSTSSDGSGSFYKDCAVIKNLSSESNGFITLYAIWKDNSAPVINVTPNKTYNPDTDNNAVKSVDISISISETGSGLSPDNLYEYGFSSSPLSPPVDWEVYALPQDLKASGTYSSAESLDVTLPELGGTQTGYYYLWIKQVKDNFGNLSTSPDSLACVDSCHVYGIYAFDNTAPTGTVKYIENNYTLGLYDTLPSGNPYAVMSIYDAADNMAGISHHTLVIYDSDNPENFTEFDFEEDNDVYICRFNLYTCLDEPENIGHVGMYVKAVDKLGNEAAIPIKSYDFGTLQSGKAICADDIGFSICSPASELPSFHPDGTSENYIYKRDAFRVETYIENISHGSGGTTFMGGQKGILRIYTFGNVHAVYADFGSVKKFINPIYDISPDLGITTLSPLLTAHIYMHEFFIPLYCASSTYTDTTAYGVKKAAAQHRNVIYDVDGTLTNNIRTILKYNAD